ncbi:delta-60 repeat domain-containing protein [bacterium]|nr:delta-60 repeat domain-containing protein [bacterium]
MKIKIVKMLLACVAFACGAVTFAAMPGSNDGFDPNAGGAVRALAVQADGKIILGGDFTAVGGAVFTRIARINADGTTDTTFAAAEVDDSVVAVAIQTDGKILIGGRFNHTGGAVHNYIARLNTDGSIDPEFLGTGANGWVDAIAVQPDGKIVVGGSFSSINGKESHKIARLQANGLVDNSFDGVPGADRSVFALALQPDGKIIAAGEYTGYDGEAHNRIVRLNASGSLDGSFVDNIGPSSNITALKLQADGKILLGGYFQYYNGGPIGRVVRLNPNGSLDTTFNAGDGADDYINAIETQPDGRILVVGSFMNFDGTIRSRIARLELTGALDATFIDTQTSDTICAVALQPDGKIVIGGDFTAVGGAGRNHIARLNADGSPDTTFFAYYYNPLIAGEGFQPHAAVVRPDGRIILAGDNFATDTDDKWQHVRIVNADGSYAGAVQFPLPNLRIPNMMFVNAVALYPDGRMLVAGKFLMVQGVQRYGIARLRPDFSVDITFYAEMLDTNIVSAMAIQPDGKILIGGSFDYVGIYYRHNIARLNTDGSLDATFDPGDGADYPVNSFSIQPDGKIFVGGSFTRYHNEFHSHLVRVNPDGSPDNSFWIYSGPDGQVNSIILLPGGKVLVGGMFTTFNGMPRNHVARLNANGSHDLTFGTSQIYDREPNGRVESMALQADGKIMIGGNFLDYNRSGRNYIARLNEDGSVDAAFNNSNFQDAIRGITVQPDGKIIAGGMLNYWYDEVAMRLANPTAARQELSVSNDGNSVTWKLGGSFPWPFRVLFEESADGENWNELGWGTVENGVGYRISGLASPIARNHYVRATAWTACGMYNASTSIYRSVLWNGQPEPPFTGAVNWVNYE